MFGLDIVPKVVGQHQKYHQWQVRHIIQKKTSTRDLGVDVWDGEEDRRLPPMPGGFFAESQEPIHSMGPGTAIGLPISWGGIFQSHGVSGIESRDRHEISV